MCSLNAFRSNNLAPVGAGIIHLLVNEIFSVVITAANPFRAFISFFGAVVIATFDENI